MLLGALGVSSQLTPNTAPGFLAGAHRGDGGVHPAAGQVAQETLPETFLLIKNKLKKFFFFCFFLLFLHVVEHMRWGKKAVRVGPRGAQYPLAPTVRVAATSQPRRPNGIRRAASCCRQIGAVSRPWKETRASCDPSAAATAQTSTHHRNCVTSVAGKTSAR